MSALFVLIGISILVAGSFLTAFLFSVKNGQYDDDYTPSVRMLFDDGVTSAGNMKAANGNNQHLKAESQQKQAAGKKRPSTKNNKI
ncbi:MAG: cbb3-type cytochrome oxidase assembly protein CcoS [Ferruginibacter sp.]